MDQPKQPHWSTKMGFYTGPLFVIAGIFLILKKASTPIALVIITLGIVRFISSYKLYKRNKENTNTTNP